MTPQERDIISRFIARVGGAPSGFQGGAAQGSVSQGSVPQGSVPQGGQPALPPVDPEADSFIGEQFQSHPEARYRITQLAFVQEAALAEAQNRIKQLEYALSQAQQQAQSAPQGGQGRGGFFSNLFGGGSSQGQARPGYAGGPQYQAPPPPPQAAYPSGYQPGMLQSGGSGFLGSALRTAAGVAGGVLAADAISSMFSPHGYGGGFGGGGFGGGPWGGGGEVVNETVVNNYGDAAPGGGADPWGGAGTTDSSSWDQGAAPDQGGGGGDWGGSGDAGGGDWGGGGDAGGGDAGWDDNSGGGGDGSW